MAKQYSRTTKSKMYKSVPISMVKAGKDDNLIFTISTSTPDRDEDILEPKGCQLKNYKKNSVVLFAHDYHSLPIGKSVNIRKLDEHIEAEVEFAPTQFAQEVRVLCEQGFLNAASVGFIPLESEPIEQKDDDGDMLASRGFRFKRWDLLEWSIVPVPSNFEALIQNAKAKGIGVKAMEEELVKEELVKEEPFGEVDITQFHDKEKVLLDPNTGEKRTEPFEDTKSEEEFDPRKLVVVDADSFEEEDDEPDVIEFDEEHDTLTIADTEAFKEIHISEKMAEKLFIDRESYAEKAGRVLSAANEKKVKSARDSLTEVLEQLENEEEEKSTSVEVEEYLKCPNCDSEIPPPYDDMIKNDWKCPECEVSIPEEKRWKSYQVKREVTLEELIERLEIAVAMIAEERASEKETEKPELYLELDIKEPENDDVGFTVDMDELAEVIRSSIRPEISELKRGITGKIE